MTDYYELRHENEQYPVGVLIIKLPYHGGSTLSSGALPKWDLFDKKYMIKRAASDEFGDA